MQHISGCHRSGLLWRPQRCRNCAVDRYSIGCRRPSIGWPMDGLTTDLGDACHRRGHVPFGGKSASLGDPLAHSQSRRSIPLYLQLIGLAAQRPLSKHFSPLYVPAVARVFAPVPRRRQRRSSALQHSVSPLMAKGPPRSLTLTMRRARPDLPSAQPRRSPSSHLGEASGTYASRPSASPLCHKPPASPSPQAQATVNAPTEPPSVPPRAVTTLWCPWP